MTTFNDVMDADDRERPQREADRRLGAAWRRAMEVLPTDWAIDLAGHPNRQVVMASAYDWRNRDDIVKRAVASGTTPTLALEALAEKLESLP